MHYLIDAGEDTCTQLQFSQNKTHMAKLRNLSVLITHEHADHYLGLGTFLQRYFEEFGLYPAVVCPPLVKEFLQLSGVKCNTVDSMLLIQSPMHLCEHTITAFKTNHTEVSVSYLISNG